MDWTDQTDNILKTWADAQKRIWDQWSKMIQGVGGSQAAGFWDKTLETWQEFIKKTQDAQTEWFRVWSESYSPGRGASEEITEWAKRGQEMMKHWAQVQTQLWENWFPIMKELSSSIQENVWDRERQKLIKLFQEAAEKAMKSQAEWIRHWTGGQAGDKSKAKKTAKL